MAQRDPKDWPDRLQDAGRAMSRLGWSLTWSITAPVLGFVVYGWIGLLVGVLIGMAILGVGRSRAEGQSEPPLTPARAKAPEEVPAHRRESDRSPCPRCGESIPMAAMVCRFCGLDLVAYDEEVLGTPE